MIVSSSPSFSMAMIRTINGGKSYSQIDARRTNPNCIQTREINYILYMTRILGNFCNDECLMLITTILIVMDTT
uniref:Uncharacterized protein n=1 Tax=Oryza punctata TaxID=4537 RepID=A0A0E0LYI5_ORYPU